MSAGSVGRVAPGRVIGVYTLAARACYALPLVSPFPSTNDPAAYADRRAFPRVEVALPAFLQAEGERHAVRIVDLSAGGAKLDCPARLPTGTAVTLDCGTLGRTAVVRWQTAGVLGLCFDSELDPRDVSDLAERSKALTARRKDRE